MQNLTAQVKFDSIEKSDKFKNSRHQLNHVDDLIQSLITNGLISPLVVYKEQEDDDNYTLVSGFRRHKAIEKIRMQDPRQFEQIMCTVIKGDVLDASRVNIVENIQREDLSPIEIAEYLEHMQSMGMEKSEMSEMIGKSSAWVHVALTFLEKACPTLVNAVKEHKISYSLAMQIAEKVEEPAEQTKIVQKHLHLLENMGVRKAAKQTKDDLKEGEDNDESITTSKKRKLRAFREIQDKLDAYMTMDTSGLDSEVKAFVYGIQTMGAWVLNHEVNFDKVQPVTIADITPTKE